MGTDVEPKDLDARQMKAIALELAGKTRKEVAAGAGVSEKTISTWRNHNEKYKAELIRNHEESVSIVQNMRLDGQVRLAQLIGMSVDVIKEVVNERDEEGRPTARAISMARFIAEKAVKFDGDEGVEAQGQVNAGIIVVNIGDGEAKDVPEGATVIDLPEGSIIDG